MSLISIPELVGTDKTAKLIRSRIVSCEGVDEKFISYFLERIEFSLKTRFKLRARRAVRNHIFRPEDTKIRSFSANEFISGVNQSNGRKTVLFIARHPTHDFVRISDALRKTGEFETGILVLHPTLKAMLHKHFDYVYVYPSMFDLAAVMTKLRPWLVQVQGSSAFYPFPFLARALMDTPLITTVMDIPSIFKPNEAAYEGRGGEPDYVIDRTLERFPYSHSDGITMFNHKIEAGTSRREKWASDVPLIEFHNYPEETATYSPRPLPKSDDEIHIVYAGVIEPSSVPVKWYADLQLFSLIDKITAQKLHFHVYPSPHYDIKRQRKRLSEYVTLETTNPFFHFHDPLPVDKIGEELVQYDYGAMLFMFKEAGFDFLRVHAETGVIASKFFTYLQAGLPILVVDTAPEAARRVNEYGSGLVIREDELEELGVRLHNVDRIKISAGVATAQASLGMNVQFPRLLTMYDEAVERYTAQNERTSLTRNSIS